MRPIFSAVICSLLAIALSNVPANAVEIPPIVKKHFETYAVSHPKKKKRSSDRPDEQIFADFFFIGLTSQNEVWTSVGIETDAYNQGQLYWRDHPNKRELILASYGYVRVDAKGIWRCGFEQSSFTPIGRKNEEWWVSSFRGASWGNLLGSNCNKIHNVRIVGYLSPIGSYGHLGSYKREVFFTSLTVSSH